MSKIPDLYISEGVFNIKNGRQEKVAVFLYTGKGDPAKVLDYAIHQYVGGKGYNELIDANLDNPWMRVVLAGINEMNREQFDDAIHKL